MSRWLPEFGRRLALGFGAGRLAWRSPAGDGSIRADEPLAALREAVGLTACRALDVTVGNDIAVHWLQQPPRAVRSLGELQQVARMRCAQLYGGTAEDWWIAGDWHAGRPFACAGLPRPQLQGLLDAAHAMRLHLRWQTAWATACRRRAAAIPELGWNAVRSPAAAMLWHCTSGRVDCIARVGAGMAEAQGEVQDRVEQRVAMECLRDTALRATPVRWHPAPAGSGTASCEAHAALGWSLAASGEAA